MNDKLQEIVNETYENARIRIHQQFYNETMRNNALARLPQEFAQVLEKYGCLMDCAPFEKKPNNMVIVKHPADIRYGRSCYPNLLIPYEFAVKVVALGYLPKQLN